MAETNHTFLERKRDQLKTTAAIGWLFLVIPLLFGVVVATEADQVVEWVNRFHGPMSEQLSSESEELQSLVTATELERILVQLVVRKNELIDRLFNVLFISGMAVFGFTIMQICFVSGAMLLGARRDNRRFLALVDDLERRAGLGTTESSS
jgi:predicted PurR-regulated permease PerM